VVEGPDLLIRAFSLSPGHGVSAPGTRVPSSMSDAAPSLSDADGASITVYEDGPLILRGPVALLAMDGSQIDAGRRTVALCRCGYSAIRPFCDGSHRRARFTAPGGDERGPAPESGADPQLRLAPAVEQGAAGGSVEGQAAAGAPEDV
jgi:CDGSH-type Zn-finger protein